MVEFTGCTGAGKTTISFRVIEKLQRLGVETVSVHPRMFVLGGRLSEGLTNETAQNIIMDLRALKRLFLSFNDHYELLRFSLKILRYHADSLTEALNLFRSVCRKTGIYHLLRSNKFRHKMIVVDEGSVHSIHNLFVHLNSVPNQGFLSEFSRLVQLPDLIVYVHSPLNVLLEQARNRKDPPRRLTGTQLVKFVENARQVFEEFMSIDIIKERTLTVNYNKNNSDLVDTLANQITDYILRIRNNAGLHS